MASGARTNGVFCSACHVLILQPVTQPSGAMPLPSWEQPAMKSEGLLGAGDSQGEKVWVVVQAAERVTVCGKSFHKDTEPKLRLCLTHHGVTSWGGWRTSTY